MQIFLAIVLGTLFGFVLHRIAAANPQVIIDMLRLKDLRLMKTIIFAIGLASCGLFLGLVTGLIDVTHLSVKASYTGVILGGGLLGLGWAISGFCPGTGVVAAGAGRKDAWYFIVGGLLGAFAYMLTFPWFEASGLLNNIAGGKVTVAATGNDAYPALLGGLPGWLVALAIGTALMVIAWKLPVHPRRGENAAPPRHSTDAVHHTG
jgi:uncharacterized membrane protein YedE/YeeE